MNFSSNTEVRGAARVKPPLSFLLDCGGQCLPTGMHHPANQPTEGSARWPAWPGQPERITASFPRNPAYSPGRGSFSQSPACSPTKG